ncbi:MAG TPA: anthranilate synthase component I family protein [Candidatus Aminicenantes bacterium]|nr:anthranilate synthase component I family protein [Candidatus Aminicenantes bacterium]
MTIESKTILPSEAEFRKAAKSYNIVPVSREIRADFETPLSIFLKCRGDFLLESIERGEHVGRYSFVACGKKSEIELRGRRITIREKNSSPTTILERETTNPLEDIRAYLGSLSCLEYEHLPPFFGGVIGFLGYEAAAYFEKIPIAKIGHDFPDGLLVIPEVLLVYDSVKRSVCIIVLADGLPEKKCAYRNACRVIMEYEKLLAAPMPNPQQKIIGEKPLMKAESGKEKFIGGVETCRELIRKGEIIQVVLSQGFSARVEGDPFPIYQALRAGNPSPYLFYLDFGCLILIGSSPEMLVKVEGREVLTKPIAGTRPRGKTISDDNELARELLDDPKERAEHLMLVDLARNDLGRVAVAGSIEVVDFMSVERYSHVMHLVSTVRAELEADRDVFDLITAAFPAGTLSGAPKIRAMEIISEIEGRQRGPYGGMVFYLGFNGNLDSCITIRTIVIKDQQAMIRAGAGIVLASDPGHEYRETLDKAAALFQAIASAHDQGGN